VTDEHVYYHVVFTVTYGKPVFLVPEVDAAFKDLVRELSHKQGWLLIELETMPNHVHLLIEKAPWEDPRQIIKAVKAFTARRPTPPRPPVVATVILRRLAGIQPPCHLRAGSDYARNSIAHPRHTTSPAIGLHAFHTLPGISHRHAAPRVVCAGIGLALGRRPTTRIRRVRDSPPRLHRSSDRPARPTPSLPNLLAPPQLVKLADYPAA
jgi:REP element-mobilizing transposase RayT